MKITQLQNIFSPINTGIYGIKLVTAIAKYQPAKIIFTYTRALFSLFRNVMNNTNLKIIEKQIDNVIA